MVAEIISPGEGPSALGYLADKVLVATMHCLDMATQVLRTHEALRTDTTTGVGVLIRERACVVALLRVDEGVHPLAEFENRRGASVRTRALPAGIRLITLILRAARVRLIVVTVIQAEIL